MVRLFLSLLALVVAGADTLPAALAAEGKEPEPVRVGIVAFEDIQQSGLGHERQLWEDLARKDRSLSFRLAVGTYGDVLHWLEEESIDIACLPPGVFSQTLADEGETERASEPGTSARNEDHYELLAGVGLTAAQSPWADAQRRTPGYHSQYRSLCVVRKDSKLNTLDELRAAAGAGKIEFLLVHPLSVAGCIAPLKAFSLIGIHPHPEQIRFTYSHSESLRLAAEADAERTRVAFVWDDA